jgi:hypothetical protein
MFFDFLPHWAHVTGYNVNHHMKSSDVHDLEIQIMLDASQAEMTQDPAELRMEFFINAELVIQKISERFNVHRWPEINIGGYDFIDCKVRLTMEM